ncbi:MAG: SH3 domain-containing protein [Anaerolineales bacterium]
MIHFKTEQLFFSLFKWLISAMALAMLLTSCNPYEGLTTAAPKVTPTAVTQTPGIPTAPPTPTPARVCIVVTGVPNGKLNIRNNAGIGFAVIGLLHEGQTINLTDQPAQGIWIQIKTADVIGWINSTYCKIGQ